MDKGVLVGLAESYHGEERSIDGGRIELDESVKVDLRVVLRTTSRWWKVRRRRPRSERMRRGTARENARLAALDMG